MRLVSLLSVVQVILIVAACGGSQAPGAGDAGQNPDGSVQQGGADAGDAGEGGVVNTQPPSVTDCPEVCTQITSICRQAVSDCEQVCTPLDAEQRACIQATTECSALERCLQDQKPVVSDAGVSCNNQKDGTCQAGCSRDPDCTCTPSCSGKVCGDDGCGGTCGSCGANEICSSQGTSCECFGGFQEVTLDGRGLDWTVLKRVSVSIAGVRQDGTVGPRFPVELTDAKPTGTQRYTGCSPEVIVDQLFFVFDQPETDVCDHTDAQRIAGKTTLLLKMPTKTGRTWQYCRVEPL